MKLEISAAERDIRKSAEAVSIIDCDFHNSNTGRLGAYLPTRWRQYVETVGQRNVESFGSSTQGRPGACRLDAVPPSGGPPGSDIDFVREQLLDEYGMAAVVMNNLEAMPSGNAPVELELELARATNDCHVAEWLSADKRFLASICVAGDHPHEAAKEIARCRSLDDRFVQVLLGSRGERPYGNPKYWPLYEAAVHHDLPVAFHVGTSKYHHWSGAGSMEYYYEVHTSFPLAAQSMLASLIFEGVFERFPTLKIVLVELGWEWAVPFAWRLDATWRVLQEEVPHLSQPPSEYMRKHLWFTTQPQVEPEHAEDYLGVFDQFQKGIGNRLLFATDYPHWDMDSPFEAIPATLAPESKRQMLGENAAELYGLEIGASKAGVLRGHR